MSRETKLSFLMWPRDWSWWCLWSRTQVRSFSLSWRRQASN